MYIVLSTIYAQMFLSPRVILIDSHYIYWRITLPITQWIISSCKTLLWHLLWCFNPPVNHLTGVVGIYQILFFYQNFFFIIKQPQ